MTINDDDYYMHLLTMIIKNKVTRQARRHIQEKVAAALDKILNSLHRASPSRADTSQLSQELEIIKRRF